MNNLDKQYTDLLQDILDNGVTKETRNGGTLSVFGRQIRHKMSEGFPLITTKKMPFRLIATELMWFLSGDTNIKFLVDNNCHIWNGDAYKRFTYYTDEETSMEKSWNEYNLRGDSGVSLFTVLDVSIGLWGCNKFGDGFIDYGKGWQHCAGSDFDSSKYATTGPSVMTDEERAILEERGQAAESETQAPSSEYSNVTPMQGCTSLGQVVQTESYGQLTCKLVLMNRIKALVWMRS